MRALFYLLVVVGLSSMLRCEPVDEVKTLQPTLTKYQHAFAMDSWKINLHVGTLGDIKRECPSLKDAVACGTWTGNPATGDMAGEIWVLQKDQYTDALWEHFGVAKDEQRPAEVDQRNSVVHELLHVVWEYAQEEPAIAMIAGAINP
jgi:hypothetical protein